LNSTFGFRIVLAPNYLLMTLIRVSVTRGVTSVCCVRWSYSLGWEKSENRRRTVGLRGGNAAGKQGGGSAHPFCGLVGVGVWRRWLSPELGISGDNGDG
jgi:hypothetical protein